MRLVISLVAIGIATVFSATASSTTPALGPGALERAKRIRVETSSRYLLLPGPRLAVTEASSTGDVVESFRLLAPDMRETRTLAADNGVYYAICPPAAICPYPAPKFARPAADIVPRRLALELALRTFLETSADVVAVSLPTPRFILFVVERRELTRDVGIAALAKALNGDPRRALSQPLEHVVDRLTRPRLFLDLGLASTRSGRASWFGLSLARSRGFPVKPVAAGALYRPRAAVTVKPKGEAR